METKILSIILLSTFFAILTGVLSFSLPINPDKNENRDMRVICINRLEDLQSNNSGIWNVWENLPFDYAATGQDLPGELRGKLEADGIFYIEGRDPRVNLGMYLLETLTKEQAPVSLYLRYYGHIAEYPVYQNMMVGPAIYYDEYEIIDKKIPKTKNFTWGETMVEINPTVPFYIHFGCRGFDPQEYFLFDKLIITFGFPGRSAEAMVNLCP